MSASRRTKDSVGLPGAAGSHAPAAKKATVLALHKAKGGKVYQVLAPAARPKHLSNDDIDRMIDAMVAAR